MRVLAHFLNLKSRVSHPPIHFKQFNIASARQHFIISHTPTFSNSSNSGIPFHLTLQHYNNTTTLTPSNSYNTLSIPLQQHYNTYTFQFI